jgi:hypothetical protein
VEIYQLVTGILGLPAPAKSLHGSKLPEQALCRIIWGIEVN